MMEAGAERLFRAIGGVGGDLVDLAERRRYPVSRWKRLAPLAACLALLVGLGLLFAPAFHPKQEFALFEDVVGPLPGTAEEMVQHSQTNAPAEEAEPLPTAVEQLVVRDTIYYLEAVYSPEEASPHLGTRLDVVEQADRPELAGAAVYTKDGSTDRDDLPLEIFIQGDGCYYYALTYYAPAGPVFTREEALALWSQWENSGWMALSQTFALDAATFDRASDLNADELLQLFLLTLKLERELGKRTADLDRYLWLAEDGTYLVHPADLTRQLDRYLEGYHFLPEQCRAYDSDRAVLVLHSLEPTPSHGVLIPLEHSTFDPETGVLNLHVVRCADAVSREPLELRSYEIRFTETGCILDRILSVEE